MRKGSECLGTGQRPLDYQNDSQPASSIVAASSFSFFFPFCRRTAAISLPHQQLQCQGPRAIAPSSSREMFYLFEVLRPPWTALGLGVCIFVCLYQAHYFCIHFHTQAFLALFDCVFFLCLYGWDFCILRAFLHQKKKHHRLMVASDPSVPTPAPGKRRWKRSRRSPLTSSSPHGQKFSLCRFSFSLIFCASRQFLVLHLKK